MNNNINSEPDYNDFYKKFYISKNSNSNNNSNSQLNSNSNSQLNKAAIGCRTSGAYIFWKINKNDNLEEFNIKNKKVLALLGYYCNYNDIESHLNTNIKNNDAYQQPTPSKKLKKKSKLKLVEIDINNNELKNLDKNLQKSGSCICTLFNYEQGKLPSRKFENQPLHIFTLEYNNNDKYILHQSCLV